jgi:hypothetical protein
LDHHAGHHSVKEQGNAVDTRCRWFLKWTWIQLIRPTCRQMSQHKTCVQLILRYHICWHVHHKRRTKSTNHSEIHLGQAARMVCMAFTWCWGLVCGISPTLPNDTPEYIAWFTYDGWHMMAPKILYT